MPAEGGAGASNRGPEQRDGGLAMNTRTRAKWPTIGVLGAAAALLSAALVVPVVAMAPSAGAAGTEMITNGDFTTSTAAGGLVGATTDFQVTTSLTQAYTPGSMYDPGVYVVGNNPITYHSLWADFGTTASDPMMILNGHTVGTKKVWSQTVDGTVCNTPGSTITYDFTMYATNIYAADANGANIFVTINGKQIGEPKNLTGVNPANGVQLVGAVPAAPKLEVTIWNSENAYSGNDFAIDDISLVQQGFCEPPCQDPATAWFNYTGKYTGTEPPLLNDPNWHALPAQPGGQHSLDLRHLDTPYQPSIDKGKGDWFVWMKYGGTCLS